MTSFYGDKHFVLGNHSDDTKNIRVEAHADGTFTFKRKTDGSGDSLLSVSAAGVVSFPKMVNPAFSAYQSTLQSLVGGAYTKLKFQTEETDATNAFDSVTDFRFKPTVAGWYNISGGVICTTATYIVLAVFLSEGWYKNIDVLNSASNVNGSCLVHLNGSDQYVDLRAYVDGATQNSIPSAAGTYFQACLVARD